MTHQIDRTEIETRVAAEVAEIEELAAREAPGVLTLLDAYGVAEDAVRRMDAYFDWLHPTPRFSVATGTGR